MKSHSNCLGPNYFEQRVEEKHISNIQPRGEKRSELQLFIMQAHAAIRITVVTSCPKNKMSV